MANEFRVILEKDKNGEGMRMRFPGMDRMAGCQKLAEIATCKDVTMATGWATGYFLSFFYGSLGYYLYKIEMLSDMVPVFVFRDITGDEMSVTLKPERIEMVVTKHKMTEIIIREE